MKLQRLLSLTVLFSVACNFLFGVATPTPTSAPTSVPTAALEPTGTPEGIPVPTEYLGPTPAEWRDFGDAPDGAPTGYTSGASDGQFVTRAETGGPAHEVSYRFWLGEAITAEDAPLEFADAGDDGLLVIAVAPCALSQAALLINVAGLPAEERQQPLYLNLFFDWNRDGLWEGGDRCSPEWALQNYPVNLAEWDPASPRILALPYFISGEQTDEFWHRVTLTAEPLTGPAGAAGGGETEDYFYVAEAGGASGGGGVLAAPARLPPAPPTPTFQCEYPVQFIDHKQKSITFKIVQTEESLSQVVNPDSLQVKPHGPETLNVFERPAVTKTSSAVTKQGNDFQSILLALEPTIVRDPPDRWEGPFYLTIRVQGVTQGGAPFNQQVACYYYILHDDAANLQSSFYLRRVVQVDGLPPRVSRPTGFSGPQPLPPTFKIYSHGEEFTVEPPDDSAGRYDPNTWLFSDENAILTVETVKVLDDRRGVTLKADKDAPDRIQRLDFVVRGVDGAGKPIFDIFFVFVRHCRPPSGGGGLFHPAPGGSLLSEDEACPRSILDQTNQRPRVAINQTLTNGNRILWSWQFDPARREIRFRGRVTNVRGLPLIGEKFYLSVFPQGNPSAPGAKHENKLTDNNGAVEITFPYMPGDYHVYTSDGEEVRDLGPLKPGVVLPCGGTC